MSGPVLLSLELVLVVAEVEDESTAVAEAERLDSSDDVVPMVSAEEPPLFEVVDSVADSVVDSLATVTLDADVGASDVEPGVPAGSG